VFSAAQPQQALGFIMSKKGKKDNNETNTLRVRLQCLAGVVRSSHLWHVLRSMTEALEEALLA
jgi:hypothetical protein